MKENKKPEKVTSTGLLGIAIGLFGIVYSGYNLISLSSKTNPILSGVISIIMILISILLLIASSGLLIGKEWARKTYYHSIISVIIFTPIYLIAMVYSSLNDEGMIGIILIPEIIFAIIFIIYLISVIRYINKPETKEYFN